MPSYQYRKSHCGDKTVVRSSYLHNGMSYTGKMAYFYWISPQVFLGLVEVNCVISDRGIPLLAGIPLCMSRELSRRGYSMSQLCSIRHGIPIPLHTPWVYGQCWVFDHSGDKQSVVLGTRYGTWWPWYCQFEVGWVQPLQLWLHQRHIFIFIFASVYMLNYKTQSVQLCLVRLQMHRSTTNCRVHLQNIGVRGKNVLCSINHWLFNWTYWHLTYQKQIENDVCQF